MRIPPLPRQHTHLDSQSILLTNQLLGVYTDPLTQCFAAAYSDPRCESNGRSFGDVCNQTGLGSSLPLGQQCCCLGLWGGSLVGHPG
jgi:hypothetical protein